MVYCYCSKPKENYASNDSFNIQYENRWSSITSYTEKERKKNEKKHPSKTITAPVVDENRRKKRPFHSLLWMRSESSAVELIAEREVTHDLYKQKTRSYSVCIRFEWVIGALCDDVLFIVIMMKNSFYFAPDWMHTPA